MAIPAILQKKKLVIGLSVAILLLVASAPSIYFYRLYKTAQIKANPTAAATQDAQVTVAEVSKLMELPTGEVPTVALITDITKLKDQTFFSSAKNGDKVLIYTQAKQAILYRPSINKIINVAPVNIGSSNTSSSSAQVVTPTPIPAKFTVVLRNGTKTTALTQTMEAKLTSKVTGVTVTGRGNANTADYTKTILVDVSGTNSVRAESIASTLGITVGLLPKGESTPSADFLIIVGSDQK